MTALAASAGFAIDRAVGEPPVQWHPVAWFGSTMTAIESRWYADDRARGVGYALAGVTVAVLPGVVLRRLVGSQAAAAVASALAIAGAMLEREALGVADALHVDDIDAARRSLGGLVGRSTDQLDEAEISRAVIETVAENTVDAVTATLFWASIWGAPGALAHRAINTMDAMVGHRNERYARFGFTSARLDDIANWVPARLTAVAVAVAAPKCAADVWRVIRRDAGAHPSPNGGVIEAAFAAGLGLRLGGANVYGGVMEDRGVLGSGRSPVSSDIARATTLARRVGLVFAAGCIVARNGRLLLRRRD